MRRVNVVALCALVLLVNNNGVTESLGKKDYVRSFAVLRELKNLRHGILPGMRTRRNAMLASQAELKFSKLDSSSLRLRRTRGASIGFIMTSRRVQSSFEPVYLTTRFHAGIHLFAFSRHALVRTRQYRPRRCRIGRVRGAGQLLQDARSLRGRDPASV